MKKGLFIILLAIILLMIPAFPAAAKADHIPISGSCTLFGYPPSPDFRYWQSDDIIHWRNINYLLYCDFNDPQLTGNYVSTDNWDYFILRNSGAFQATTFGSGYSSDENGNKTEFWEGLTVQMTLKNTSIPYVYDSTGVMIDPRK
jgi:hypothetical protein